MNKQLITLSAFTTFAMLVVAFALVSGYISAEEASLSILLTFMSGACLVFWRNRRRKLGASPGEASKASGLVWLLALFSANACVGIIQAIREGWDVGYTIGLAGFAVFASLSIYEILRRRRKQVNGPKGG